jgi:acylphosphatase
VYVLGPGLPRTPPQVVHKSTTEKHGFFKKPQQKHLSTIAENFRYSRPHHGDPRTASATRKHVQVKGVVQGVGFRPFVYKLAQSLELTGYVFNSSSGVTIEIEGKAPAIDEFLKELSKNPRS